MSSEASGLQTFREFFQHPVWVIRSVNQLKSVV